MEIVMKILEALEETGRAERAGNINSYVAKTDEGVLYWYNATTHDRGAQVSLDEIFGEDWRPHPLKPEVIVPTEAGELWSSGINPYHTDLREGVLLLIGEYAHHITRQMIHGKNGWTRVWPVVEEGVREIEVYNSVQLDNAGSKLGYPLIVREGVPK